jgi:PKD domain
MRFTLAGRRWQLASGVIVLWGAFFAAPALALEKPGVTYPVFQFPPDHIPRIDGNADDWAMVPESYVIGTDQLTDDTGLHAHPDPKTLDVRVRVGWVKGLNRLYFLYEANDDYWDFSLPGLHNDTFEVVVDGDASGGPLIDKGHKEFWTPEEVGAAAAAPDDRISTAEAHWAIHGVQAQNYHIFTPALNKDWALAWGAPSWIKEFPWANAAYSYHFKPGEKGKLTLEFWITPFDYAGPEGPQRAVESVLRENKIIGLSWAIIDYDDVNATTNNGFWNLSPQHTMYGNASELCAFRLMPLEPMFRKPIEAQWSFSVVDMDRRLVAFKDQSVGQIDAWRWDFGDGSLSTEQHPLHHYDKPGAYVVILDVTGPAGTSRRSKVWDIQLR